MTTPPYRLQMPFLMTVGMAFSALFAGSCALGLVFSLLGTLLGFGSYHINEQEVTASEFLLTGAPFLLLFGALTGAIAYGLRKERLWTRKLVIVFWLLVSAIMIGFTVGGRSSDTTLLEAILWSVIYLGTTAAYFYLKPSVVQYYNTLRTRAESPTAMPSRGEADA